MGINISGDGNDAIMFEVKGKISLTLTRQGVNYRGELIKDSGEMYELMMKFLGLAEAEVQKRGEAVTLMKNPQQRLEQMAEMKQTLAIIQRSKSGEDDSQWEDLMPADVPIWVQEMEPMTEMLMKGAKLQSQEGEYWYRAVHVVPQQESEEIH